MAYRRKTLRGMSPVTRKLARLRGELASLDRRLANLVPEVQSMEIEAQALRNQGRLKNPVPQVPEELFTEEENASALD
jgi:hypothetical protein